MQDLMNLHPRDNIVPIMGSQFGKFNPYKIIILLNPLNDKPLSEKSVFRLLKF